MNYVFYDFETSGMDVSFDQPIQIAATLVDENLNILETLNERCYLRDGVIPHPKALLITKVGIDSLKNGQSFYEMMKKIHTKFQSWSPSVFIGYNSIWFDEEVLRNSLFQSLFDPYLTISNENSRADLYKMVIALNGLNLDLINIPIDNKTEKKVFKLTSLSEANNIQHEMAHDALSDVMATIELAKIIQNKDSSFWETCLKARSARTLSEFLQSDEYFFSAPIASNSNKYCPITFITANPNYNKELAFFDLNHDPEKYLETRISGIISLIESKQKIIRLIKSNRFPIILNTGYLEKINFCKEELDHKLYRERVRKIKTNESFIERVNQSLVDRWEETQADYLPSDYPEKQIYQKFLGNEDKSKMKDFNNSSNPINKIKICSQLNDDRLRHFANKIIYDEYPDELTERERKKNQLLIAEKALSEDKNVPWCTITKAKESIESIRSSNEYQDQKDYIDQIEGFIKSEEKKYKKYIA
ncbi:MAG: exonuclease domain-containing protein [Pseudomonadota bacterium]|nr:exonuclease domain-containing protein [Pseudomonadota bacterium]